MSKGAIARTSVAEIAADRGILPDIVYSTREPKPRRARTQKTPEWAYKRMASHGGSYDCSQPPMRLCVGSSSKLSGQFSRYLEDGGVVKWCLERLYERMPAHATVWDWHNQYGEPLKSIANRIGLADGTVRWYHYVAWRELVAMRVEYRQAMKLDRLDMST